MDRLAWNARYAAAELVWSAEPNRFVAEIMAPWPPGSGLDWACGEGRNAIWLAQRGWTMTALDYSDVAIDKARRLAAEAGANVEWVCADATRYAPAAAHFDASLVSYLHLPHDEMAAVLDHATRALRDGGHLVVVAHALDNLQDGVGGPQDPSVLYAPEQVSEWARQRGLTVERAEHVRRPVDDRSAIDLVVVARR